MARPRRDEVVSAMRLRVLRAVQVGVLGPGDRLPGVREIAVELAVDPRVVAVAYRVLEAEGFVRVRPRSGVYIADTLAESRRRSTPSPAWLAELFAAGVTRGIPVPALSRALSAALGRRGVRTVVVATSVDQVEGICRELAADYGLSVRPVLAGTLEPRRALPRVVQRAQLLVTTAAHEPLVTRIATRLGKPHVSIDVRPDLFESEWALFRGRETYVLVADMRFARLVSEYLQSVGISEGVHVLVAGRDDLSRIPREAPVYATQAARARVGPTRLPDGVLPPARILAEDSGRKIMEAVIRVSSGARAR